MLTIRTNNAKRDILDAWQLTEKERKEFDYLDWGAIEKGEGSASFFRYKAQLYDLGEFVQVPHGSGLSNWHGYTSQTFFSGVVIKYCEDFERVIVGDYCS